MDGVNQKQIQAQCKQTWNCWCASGTTRDMVVICKSKFYKSVIQRGIHPSSGNLSQNLLILPSKAKCLLTNCCMHENVLTFVQSFLRMALTLGMTVSDEWVLRRNFPANSAVRDHVYSRVLSVRPCHRTDSDLNLLVTSFYTSHIPITTIW